MGMPITVDIPDCANDQIFNKIYTELERIDSSYSNYKPNSEISRFNRGEIAEASLSKELKQILSACRQAEEATNGYFSAWAKGSLDANGYIKGWAISRAGELIAGQGYKTFCIAAGGDILARGSKVWRVGIQNPFDRQKIIEVVELENQSIATSGNYERGAHIINPKTKKPASHWASVSIIGPDIIEADVMATACFAMGEKAEGFVKNKDQLLMIAVNQNKEVFTVSKREA